MHNTGGRLDKPAHLTIAAALPGRYHKAMKTNLTQAAPCRFEAFSLTSAHDDLALSALLCEPVGAIRGVVQMAHGMSEYKERYKPLMEYLAGLGYASVIHDHRGHGQSVRGVEDLGHFYEDGARGVIEDMRVLTAFAQSRWPDRPPVLLGHSMGSLAARAYAKRYDGVLSGLIVCGCPARQPGATVGEFFLRAIQPIVGGRRKSRLFDALMLGRFVRRFPDAPSPFAWVNSDPEAVSAYDADEMCGFSFTLNGYLVVLDLMGETYSAKGWGMQNPGMPVLFLSGAEDPCKIDDRRFFAAADHMRAVGYASVGAKLYPGMRHEILNEPDKQLVYADIAAFIERCTTP